MLTICLRYARYLNVYKSYIVGYWDSPGYRLPLPLAGAGVAANNAGENSIAWTGGDAGL
jgi:hypothetical protein